MDLQSALICVLVFVLSGGALILIAVFGMKVKSYEEALEEQRHLRTGLLGANQKSKSKDKKQKKAAKKAKEKPATADKDTKTESTSTKPTTQKPEATTATQKPEQTQKTAPAQKPAETPKVKVTESQKVAPKNPSKTGGKTQSVGVNAPKAHVEFELTPITEPVSPKNKKDDVSAKQEQEVKTKSAKIKSVSQTQDAQKKDDTDKKQDSEPKPKSVKPKQSVPEVPKPMKSKQNGSDPEPPKPIKTKQNGSDVEPPKPVKTKQNISDPEPPKSVKSKAPKQTVTEDSIETTVVKQQVQQTTISIKDKKKKKSEFNTLQQMTTNDKQGVNVSLIVPLVRKADLSRSETQLLIDLLLNKQHDGPVVTSEWSEGRADPVQKLKKQLAEKEKALADEQEAMTGLQGKLREVRAELNSERSRLTQNCRNLEETLRAKHVELQAVLAKVHTQNQKVQQLQAQLNEEMMNVRKMREEHNNVQIQRQQMERHLASLNEQQQEAEASFQTQLNQLRAELQEQQTINAQLGMEIRARESGHAEKEMLHDRFRQLENHYKIECEQKHEIAMQLEESRRMYSELEHRFSVTHRNENELKVRCQQHLEEARRLEHAQSQSHEEMSRLQSEVTRLNSMHKQHQDESDCKLSQMRNELTKIKLVAANDAAAEDKSKQVEILNLQNEISSLKAQLDHHTKSSKKELEAVIERFNRELEQQKSKNDELRQKNWKVMEALNVTENSLKTLKSKQIESVDIDVAISKTLIEERAKHIHFLQRIFPTVNINDKDDYMVHAEKSIKDYIESLQVPEPVADNTEVTKLQSQIVHYKTIIDDTEGILKKLQNHIEQEEITWRNELRTKDAELDLLKDQISNQLKVQIGELEDKLTTEQHARQELEVECEALRSRVLPPSTCSPALNMSATEKIMEENTRLVDALQNEQQKNGKLNEEVLRLQTACNDSLSSKVLQNHTSNGTSIEATLNELYSSASSSSISSNSTKPRPSKNKKKKGAAN